MLGTLTSYEMDQLLRTEIVGRIGCFLDNHVYVVPIIFAYDGKYIYGHSQNGKKIQMMRDNPKVCFEVDNASSISNWKSVIVHGQYEELLGEKARKAMAFFLDQLHPHFTRDSGVYSYGMKDFHEKAQDAVKSIIFRIKIDEKTGRFEKN